MSKIQFRLAALVAAALLSSGGAMAQSATLNVSATVNAVCRLYAANTDAVGSPSTTFSMTFGGTGIDPTTATGTLSPTTSVYYRCNSAAPSFTVGGSSTSPYSGTLTRTGGSETMSYSIAFGQPSTAALSSNAVALTLTGSLAQAQYQNAVAGTYTGSVAIAIAP